MSRHVLLAAVLCAAALPLPALADRVISVGGTVTEIVYLLGEEDQLVATDTSSIYPKATDDLPKVGYQRTLSAEGVLSQQPERLLITPATGPATVVAQLRDAGLLIAMIEADEQSQAGIADKIRQVARALNVPEKGDQAVKAMDEAFAALPAPQWHEAPRILFVMQATGSPMVAGEGTSADALIRMSGATNAAAGMKGYKTLTPEALVAAAPDAIMITTQGAERSGGAEAIWSVPGMSNTPAGEAKRVISLDALLALGLGPRTPEAIALIHQQLNQWDQ